MDKINSDGYILFESNGTDIKLDKECLLISEEHKSGYVFDKDANFSVVIDTALNDELIEEGFVRELINKVQTMRKDAGYEVMDHIDMYCVGSDVITRVINNNTEIIKTEVLADLISNEDIGDEDEELYIKDWNVNGENVTISIERSISD